MQWQAPESGKGDVSFYAAGIGANRNGSTSGDGAVLPQKVTLTESLVAGIEELSNVGIGIEIAPNPVKDQLMITIQSEQKATVKVQLMNATGQLFYQQQLKLIEGQQWEQIDMSQLASGVYFLQTTKENAVDTQKIIKL